MYICMYSPNNIISIYFWCIALKLTVIIYLLHGPLGVIIQHDQNCKMAAKWPFACLREIQEQYLHFRLLLWLETFRGTHLLMSTCKFEFEVYQVSNMAAGLSTCIPCCVKFCSCTISPFSFGCLAQNFQGYFPPKKHLQVWIWLWSGIQYGC